MTDAFLILFSYTHRKIKKSNFILTLKRAESDKRKPKSITVKKADKNVTDSESESYKERNE